MALVAQPCEYTNHHWTMCFRRVSFMACEFCLSFFFLSLKLVWRGGQEKESGRNVGVPKGRWQEMGEGRIGSHAQRWWKSGRTDTMVHPQEACGLAEQRADTSDSALNNMK